MQYDKFETSLKALVPVSAGVDPVTAAYAAGARVSRGSINRWRGIAAAAAMCALVPYVLPRAKPAAISPPQMVVAPPVEHSLPPIEAAMPGNIWQLRAAVLEKGLDGLPNTPIATVKPMRGLDTF